MTGTVLNDAEGQAAKAVECMEGLLAGDTYAEGEQSVYVDYVKVTADNVGQFVEGEEAAEEVVEEEAAESEAVEEEAAEEVVEEEAAESEAVEEEAAEEVVEEEAVSEAAAA